MSEFDPLNQPDGPIRFLIGAREMLRIGPDGFFIEGRRVADDASVYKSFKEWLAYVRGEPTTHEGPSGPVKPGPGESCG